ncbi:carbamoyltransferase C-terminal domain-containing protein [Candidatus Chlorohelix sp.]|uniref:carbamoyltransferase C-terminal domain-containing protein n=1 Tax=Candidatus Chlorohelix sp. TaxID=3139201 RepID=UPI003034A1EC
MFLGINYSGYHDSSVSLIDKSGNLIFAASEERFSRLKKDGRFPRLALNRVDLNTIDEICIPFLEEVPHADLRNFDEVYKDDLLLRPTPFYDYPAVPDSLKEIHRKIGKPLHYFDHHLSHAAAGYYMAGMEEAMIVTSDYGGPNCAWNMGIYKATPTEIMPLHMAAGSHFNALCGIYADVTAMLGFRPALHEGKITGLAAYGKDNPACEEALWELYKEITTYRIPLTFWVNYMVPENAPSYEVDRGLAQYYRNKLKDYNDIDIAHSVQRLVEKKTLSILSKALKSYNAKAIILAGGFFANVKVNLEIKRQLGFEEIFVCPPMGDEGVSLGAAALRWSEATGCSLYREKHHKLYLGGSVIADQPEELGKLGVNFSVIEDEAELVAQLLSEGKIVVRTTGDMEFGPRALGNRSILYQATDSSVNDWLNKKLRRTEFMPFAPFLKAENAPQLFDEVELSGATHSAEFMTICLQCKPEVRQTSPAVVHVDGTARPQLVDKAVNPELYAILDRYEAKTGLPMLINTSFNVHDEPIVASAEDALVGFFQSGLDCLVLGKSLVRREDNLHMIEIARAFENTGLKIEKNLKDAVSRSFGLRMQELVHGLQWALNQIEYSRSSLEEVTSRLEAKSAQLTGAHSAYEEISNYVSHCEAQIAVKNEHIKHLEEVIEGQQKALLSKKGITDTATFALRRAYKALKRPKDK